MYENWNGSKWDFCKARSRWHFDSTVLPVEGKDSYTYVCRFNADFTDAINHCMPKVHPNTFADRVPGIDNLYSSDAEEADLIRVGADPKMKIFERTLADDVDIFRKINDYLGLDGTGIKFHNQRCGQMVPWHIDNFAGNFTRHNSFLHTDMDNNPDIARRFIVFLRDWQQGQVWEIGNAFFSHWKAGDCITWDWFDMPHSTCNMGFENRPILQLTGFTSEKTFDALNSASRTKIVNINLTKKGIFV